MTSSLLCCVLSAPAVGAQIRPDLVIHDASGSLQAAHQGDINGWLRQVSSVALSYSPEGRTRAGGNGCSRHNRHQRQHDSWYCRA
jgi:hypothetical protein